MFVILEYNKDSYNNLLNLLKKEELTPVVLFKIDFTLKNEINQNVQKIKEIIGKNNIKYKAIQVLLPTDKLDNNISSIINNLKQEFDIVIGFGGLNKINRFFLEETNVDFILDPQNSFFNPKIDFIHHFNSGINEILCNFAKNKEIGFILSLNFFEIKTKYMAKEFGRLNQNLIFAQKYEISVYLNFIIQNESQVKSKKELLKIYSLFNINSKNKNIYLNTLENKILKNQLKNSSKFINKGIILK